MLFSIVGLLVLFFGRWLHWVSRPSHTNHVNFQGEGNPKNSPPCCHGVYDLNCATDIKGRHWDLKSESLLNRAIVPGNRLIPADFYLWQARHFCFELGSMSDK